MLKIMCSKWNKNCAREQKKDKETRNVHREQKMSKGNKKCSYKSKKVYKVPKCYLLWHSMVLNCRLCP